MPDYAFIITHELWPERVEHDPPVKGPRDGNEEDWSALIDGDGEAFTLLDDDRIPMCEGRWFTGDEYVSDPLMDYGMGMYGCTMLADENGKVIIA